MRKIIILVAMLLVAPVIAVAQSVDPCQTQIPPFVITSGSPFTLPWVVPKSVPDPSDPTGQTQIQTRINGFELKIDAGPPLAITPSPGAECPAGTPQAGKIPYSYRTTSGVARGPHTAEVTAWNFVLDANGNPTTTKQYGPPVSVPFDAADPVMIGPPPAVSNLGVRK